jgi:tetratricopeptide (TPR) repeat protein
MSFPHPDSTLSTARELAAAGRWRDVATALAPRAGEGRASGEEAILYAQALLRTGEERRALGFLRELLPSLGDGAPRELKRRALNMIGVACIALGELDEANTSLSRALELATEQQDLLLFAQASNNLGAIANLQGRHEDALWHYRLALPTLQRLGQPRLLAEAYHNMAITFRDVGKLDDADEHERRTIEYATGAGIPRLAAMGRIGRAEIALRRDDAQLAEMAARLAADELARLDDPLNEGDARRLVGAACAAQHAYASALDAFGQALDIARARGHALNEAETLRDRALMRVAQGKHDLAIEDARAAIAIFDRLGAHAEHEALERRIPWPA